MPLWTYQEHVCQTLEAIAPIQERYCPFSAPKDLRGPVCTPVPITPASVHLCSCGKQQSPHICTRVQTPKELPKEEEAQKENCGDHQQPSVAQQIKGFLVAKQV